MVAIQLDVNMILKIALKYSYSVVTLYIIALQYLHFYSNIADGSETGSWHAFIFLPAALIKADLYHASRHDLNLL